MMVTGAPHRRKGEAATNRLQNPQPDHCSQIAIAGQGQHRHRKQDMTPARPVGARTEDPTPPGTLRTSSVPDQDDARADQSQNGDQVTERFRRPRPGPHPLWHADEKQPRAHDGRGAQQKNGGTQLPDHPDPAERTDPQHGDPGTPLTAKNSTRPTSPGSMLSKPPRTREGCRTDSRLSPTDQSGNGCAQAERIVGTSTPDLVNSPQRSGRPARSPDPSFAEADAADRWRAGCTGMRPGQGATA